jgi:hypothetical protein
MAPIPFAFSVHHFVSSVGADAGFAAIVGLAILVLLYFAQARETASLRRHAEDSAEQVQQLELRVAQLSRGGVGSGTMPPAPAPAPPGMARPAVAAASAIAAARTGTAAPVAARTAAPLGARAAAPASTGIPAAPAGVGAPALSSATRLIPISDKDPATSNGGSSGAAVPSPAGPPPATAAGGATATNGSSGSGTGVTMPPPKAAPRTAARPAARPTSGRSTAPPRRPGGRSGASRVTRGFIILMSLLGIVAVVVVLLIVTSGGGSSAQSSSTAAQSAKAGESRRAHARRATVVTPASVTVAVLNGTSISNLAHDVGQRLGTAGFKQGNIATAADQTQTATVIGYLPGHKAAALLVAKSLKLGSASVQPVDQSNRTVACPASSTPCTAKVVVTVGSDLASTQTQ